MFKPSLKLTILASHGKALVSGACASFDTQGGNIGRAAGNTLRLPDDDSVADRHAAIHARHDEWHLLNTSGNAALTVNGQLVAADQETRLRSGDIVNIGCYVLQAAETLPPAWDFQMQTTSSGTPQHSPPSPSGTVGQSGTPGTPGTPRMDPLGFGSLNGLTADEPPSAGLDGLLDMPVDPLALFGAPQRGWPDPSEAHSSDLFADLAGSRPAGGFEAPAADGLRGFATRDDAPVQSAPLWVKVAQAQASAPSASTPAAITTAASPARHAFGEPTLATECAGPVSVPQYGEHARVKAAFRLGEPIRLTRASEPVSWMDFPQAPQLDSAPALLALSEAFLEGAGVRPDGLAEAGFTPEFMHTLGALARTLRAR
ncbi:FHA domain-containing protein [Paraburkholderia sp.]|uniref:FHA domain-containing protein n=1 Tax=Paraburkholderia sp. TaxID=1926495 RepID=UPI002D543A4F|nr:FHA domain-containing protein [Paraburkholderia sp.]HZZ06507.1 FHA domain-containing protein [Paraburkholderia sp.]